MIEVSPTDTTSYEIAGKEKSCMEIFCGCCDRGGCCRHIPSKIICNSDKIVIRINLMFYPTRACTTSEGIVDKIPEELLNAGLTMDEADEWLGRRLKNIGKQRNPICKDFFLCLFTFPFILFCMPCYCQRKKAYLENWNTSLQQWQDDFNREVLLKKNMFIKTQSHCHATYDKNGKHRHIERWVSIAISANEVEKLKLEPHLTGDIEDLTCCNGVNENQMCIHP